MKTQPRWKQYKKVNRHNSGAHAKPPKKNWRNYIVIPFENKWAIKYVGGEEAVIGQKRFDQARDAAEYLLNVLA